MKYLFTLLAVCFIATSILSAQDCVPQRYKNRVFDNIEVSTDLVYGRADPYDLLDANTLEDLTLDFYQPVGDNIEKRPLVISCYGGAFLFGEKEDADVQAWCDSLTRRGYACAAISYRLGLDPLFQRSAYRAVYRAVQDLRAAIRYLEEDPDGKGFNIDPDNIFVEGQSAGAITAIHTAFISEEERPIQTFASNDLPLSERSDLGCLDCSGNEFEQPVKIKGILSMWGAVENLEFIDAEENTPMLMVHGDSDPVVPYGTGSPFMSPFFPEVHGSSIMAPWLTDKGIYNEFYPYEDNMSHTVYGESAAGTFPQDSWYDIFENSHKFLYNLMKFTSPTPFGNTNVGAGESQVYSVLPSEDISSYCWSVSGGTITQDDGNQITVTWNGNVSTGEVKLIAVNYFALRGEPTSLNVAINSGDNLPVTLKSFVGKATKKGIQITWKTSNETALSHYIIEKSLDNKIFKSLEKITPNTSQSYEYFDAKVEQGINYYRLQQVDEDGTYEYSNSIAIAFQSAFSDFKVIANKEIQLSFFSSESKENVIEIMDLQGRSIFRQKLQSGVGENVFSLNIPTLSTGIYVASLRNSEGQAQQKFVVF